MEGGFISYLCQTFFHKDLAFLVFCRVNVTMLRCSSSWFDNLISRFIAVFNKVIGGFSSFDVY